MSFSALRGSWRSIVMKLDSDYSGAVHHEFFPFCCLCDGVMFNGVIEVA